MIPKSREAVRGDPVVNKIMCRMYLKELMCQLGWSRKTMGFPGGSAVKNLLQCRRSGFSPSGGKITWKRAWQPAPVLLPGESHGQRSLAGCSPQGCTESDMTEVTNSSSSSRKRIKQRSSGR